jgi:large subunit ribosomal protein L10
MPNQKNISIVEQVTDKFRKANGVYFTNYKGLNVELMNDLRRELFNAQIEYQVVKKTLAKIAASDAGVKKPIDTLINGQLAVAFTYDDPTLPARVLADFIKKNKLDTLQITGCIFENQLYSADQVSTIADLPSREVLLAQVLGALNYPMGNLLAVLNGALAELSGVLKSLSEKKKN